MTLIDRYLSAVRGYLPVSKQADIIRELSEDIHSQVADREAELGRPLTESEEEALLKKFGHPMVLAAKYRPQQHLIGPTVFPFYWFWVKVAIGVALIVHIAIAVAMLASGAPAEQIVRQLTAFPFGPAVTVFGWVTLVFALADRNIVHLPWMTTWNPRELPVPRPAAPYSRLALLFQIVGGTAFLIWWLAVPHFPFLIFGPAASFLALAPAWHAVYLPIAGFWLVSLLVLWMMLLRPDWARFRRMITLVTNGFGLVIAALLLRGGPYVTLAGGATGFHGDASVVQFVNLGIRVGLVMWAITSVVELVRELVRQLRPQPADSQPA
jgi:hypothetical protein